MSERREVVVGSVLQAHQLRQWLMAAHKAFDVVEWTEVAHDRVSVFTIAAHAEQWTGINQWLQRIGVQS